MTFFHNWQRLFSYEYRIKTAPEQAIIDELQALRGELRALREERRAIHEENEEPQFDLAIEKRIYDALVEAHRNEQKWIEQGYLKPERRW